MGVRKAFGATYGVLVRQILYENSVITLIGGLVGLLLSLLLLPVCKDFLLQSRDTALSGDMIFQPAVFFIGFVFQLTAESAFGRHTGDAHCPSENCHIPERRRIV